MILFAAVARCTRLASGPYHGGQHAQPFPDFPPDIPPRSLLGRRSRRIDRQHRCRCATPRRQWRQALRRAARRQTGLERGRTSLERGRARERERRRTSLERWRPRELERWRQALEWRRQALEWRRQALERRPWQPLAWSSSPRVVRRTLLLPGLGARTGRRRRPDVPVVGLGLEL